MTASSFLDPDQLGFQRGGSVRRMDAFLTVAGAHASVGSRLVVGVGALSAAELAQLRSRTASVRVIRLVAEPSVIAARVRERAVGGPVHLAGDDLRGLSGRALDEAVAATLQDAADTPSLPGEHVVDTTDLDPAATIARVGRALGELAGKITER